MGSFQHSPALAQLPAGGPEGRGIRDLEPYNLAILVGDETRPVEDRFSQAPAVACRILEFVGKTRGVDEQLFRNTAADHARAADAVLLAYEYACTVTGRNPRGTHTARACSDDEQIEVIVGHIVGPTAAGAASDFIPEAPGGVDRRAILAAPSFLQKADGLTGRTPATTPVVCNAPHDLQLASDIVAPFFHFATHLSDNLSRQSFGPRLRSLHALVEDDRLLRHQLTAERRFVEGERVLEFLLGEVGGVELGHLGENLRAA